MAKYHVDLAQAGGASFNIASIEAPGTSMRRFKLYEYAVGLTGTPSDAAWSLKVQRLTATATGTSKTPQPLDPADAASVTIAKDTLTGNGTLTANAFLNTIGLNNRATYRWVARPDMGEIVVPATANNGIEFVGVPTLAVVVSAYIEEQ
jgi:hypothetical protein